MYSLTGKVVIVTGASSGIGRATAHAFAAEGAQVVLVARRADVLAEVTNELAQYGQASLAFPADVVREEDLQSLCHTVVRTFGQIDVLVNNAGLSMGGALQHQDACQIRKMIDVNIYAPMRLTQLVLPLMLERNQGHIVNVSSAAGVILSPGQTTYAATRSAVIAFSHALRREVAGSGIHVSIILPGWTRTPMIDKMNIAAMRAAGLLTPFTHLDEPAVPARAIVNAVRYNRRQVLLGGSQFWSGDILSRISPLLLDWYFRLFWNTAKVLQVMKDLG